MKKKYDITTINFGNEEDIARIYKNEYIKKKGKREFSKFVRKLIIQFYRDNNFQQKFQKDNLLRERERLSKQISKDLSERTELDEKLRELGIDPTMIIY
jgi:hypothetical protein